MIHRISTADILIYMAITPAPLMLMDKRRKMVAVPPVQGIPGLRPAISPSSLPTRPRLSRRLAMGLRRHITLAQLFLLIKVLADMPQLVQLVPRQIITTER